MKEFHRTKPSRIFNGDNMDIFIECDYPIECFGAPKYYAAYLNWKGKEIALGARETKDALIKELYRWKDNPAVYKLIRNDIERFSKEIDQ